MADEIIAPAPAPESELTLDQQLEALLPTGHEKPDTQPGESSEAPKPEETTPKPGPDTSTETPAPSSDENPILAKLDEIKAEGEGEPKPEEPRLSTEQQEILKHIPDVKTAENLVGVAQGYQAFTGAFQQGNFDQVEEMLQAWNPAAFEGFLEHVYSKKVASGEWVDRWIGEKEGNPQVVRGMSALEREVKALKEQLNSRAKQEQEAETSAKREANTRAYVGHLDALFNQINFSEADRRWVFADINARVGMDPKVRTAINSGNISAVNGIFKAAVREYVLRDKAQTQKKETKQAQQEQKKAPIQASPIVEKDALPDDVRQVPKGQEDNWLDQQLGKLAAKFRK